MKTNLRIGVDIDGCLNYFGEELEKYLIEHYNLNPNKEDYGYKLLEAVGIVTYEQQNQFWRNTEHEFENINSQKDCKKYLDDLKQRNTIIIITARGYDCSILTCNWLKKNELNYDEILFNSGNKVDACKWKNIDVMIEDNPDNALALAENGFKVLLVDNKYNKKIQHKNITRCENWLDIYNKLYWD